MDNKYDSILSLLTDEIRAGKYAECRFPSENGAARRFGCGRKTIARVFEELVRRGLVVRRQGSGTFLTRKARNSTGRIGLIVHGSDYCEMFAPVARTISHLAQQIGNATEINRRVLKTFDDAAVPVILLDSDIVASPERSCYDLAAVNHFEAGRRMGEYLVRSGAKRIAYLMDRKHAPCVQQRFLGVKVGADGHTVPGVAVYAKAESAVAIRKAMKELKIDAFACYNDRTARLLITTLKKLGYRIPQDVQIGGFDDVNFATVAAPHLTTLKQPCGELAKLAFDQLLSRIDDPDAPAKSLFLDAPLVIRESTGEV